ncbi:MAG: UDP-2,3-diacylglucosamine diphosphatase LpxI [Planctomycetes bacterium]|nr:UDP-2,3-diacylglucosamine diphosphatase LpxI [Planctomycetota bacterium]
MPTIGPNTIEKLAKHGGSALVIEAGKTLVLEREKTFQLAEQLGIVVIGRPVIPTDLRGVS